MMWYATVWYMVWQSTHLFMSRHEPVRLLETDAVHRREVVAAGESAERHQVILVHTTHVQLVVPAPQEHPRTNTRQKQNKTGTRERVCTKKRRFAVPSVNPLWPGYARVFSGTGGRSFEQRQG